MADKILQLENAGEIWLIMKSDVDNLFILSIVLASDMSSAIPLVLRKHFNSWKSSTNGEPKSHILV